MIVVVVDTNVFIQALFYNDKWCREVLNREYNNEIKLAMTVDTFAELEYIIHTHALRYNARQERIYKIYRMLGNLLWRIEKVYKVTTSTICTDPNDNMFIECAIDGNAAYIVTLDGEHIIGLDKEIEKQYNRKISIYSAYQFINELNKIRLKNVVNSKRI